MAYGSCAENSRGSPESIHADYSADMGLKQSHDEVAHHLVRIRFVDSYITGCERYRSG